MFMRFVGFVLKTANANCTDAKRFVLGVTANAKCCTKRTCYETGRGGMQTTETPKWAHTILDSIALKKGLYRKRPKLTFKVSRHSCFYGKYRGYYHNEIIIYCPHKYKKTDSFTLYDGEAILLHEIAHWLNRSKGIYFSNQRRQVHGKKFYRILFRLFKQYDIPYEYAEREFRYKPKGARKGFSQIYKCTLLTQ